MTTTPAHRPARGRGRRTMAAGAAAVTALGLALVAPGGPAAGQPATPVPAAAATPALPPQTDLDPGTYEVTLLTGDRARLVVDADRHVQVSLEIGVRPDGSTPDLDWFASRDGVYVIPEDVRPHLDSGLLDPKLFDVAHLAASGFTDDAVDGLPLIIEYEGDTGAATAMRAAGVDVGGAAPRRLASLDAAAVTVDRDRTAQFWASLQQARSEPAGGARTLAAGPAIEKVWLDDVARLALDDSVPQIGAPAAWAAGLDGAGVTVAVLDTGIDAGHPDVSGRVVASRSFLEGADTTDGHGHGTHVATTVAGTGAASGGTYTGVAPGADLVIGKVCSDDGECPTSAVIAGMEWAVVEQGARIVNLSLGVCCTDGTDPLSQAVNQLSADTGALFVVAAGNNGGDYRIGAPGSADAALTVGAVDKSGQMAWFSSRGPRVGDSALKPEIVAPGVAIVAGRAAGTSMGIPVDDYYTASDGTSMATPHVTGAAALLAQQHPDWDGQQLKAALVAAAQDLGHHGYAQGAGRVDVARAVSQQVQVSPAVADFRYLPYPQEGPPRTRTLTYHNPTDDPVTLSLTATLSNVSGAAAPDGALTTDHDTITVPAGGSATVTVTLDHTRLAAGRYTGSVVATAGDLRLTTPVGVVVGDAQHRVTVKLTERDCANGVHCTGPYSSFGFGSLYFFPYDDTPAPTGAAIGPLSPTTVPAPAQSPAQDGFTVDVDVFVPAGRYAVLWEPGWLEAGTNRRQRPWLWAPQVEVTGPTVLQFDANDAVKVRHLPPQPVGDGLASSRTTVRINDDASYWSASGSASAFGHGNYWAYPSQPVTDGSFLVSHTDVLEAPQVTMAVAGSQPVELHPIYSGYRPAGYDHPTVPVRFPEGTRTLPVVDVGVGAEADYQGVDAAGKLVLVRRTGPDATFCDIKMWQLEQALAAGAAGILYNVETCAVPVNIDGTPANEDKPQIPFVSLPSAEAELIADRLRDGPVEVTVTSTPVSPYVYFVKAYELDGVPTSMDYHYPHDELMVVQASYHSRQEGVLHHNRVTRHPLEVVLFNQAYEFPVPISRTEYHAPVDPGITHDREVWGASIPGLAWTISRRDVFAAPGRTVERWNADPWVPGAYVGHETAVCAGCREGDTLWPQVYLTTGDPVYAGPAVGWGLSAGTDPDDPWAGLALYRDGQPVPLVPFLDILPSFEVPSEPGDYRLVLDLTVAQNPSHTEWEFRSGPVGPDETPAEGYLCLLGTLTGVELPCRAEPLIFLRYSGLDTDLHHRVPAPGAHHFEVTAYRQPSPDPRPQVTGLTVEVSYDGGTTWERAKVRSLGDGRYAVTVIHPPDNRRASDSVTLRVEAWDADGNRVRQTLTDAYRLTGRGPGQCGTGGCPAVVG